MTASNNMTLNIERSLSYTIDKQLDTELGVDVRLNLAQWNTVFEVVKNDTATTNPQYGGGNDDITNGKNYIVQANQAYQLTQNAWKQIVDIAKKAMGIAGETTEEVVTEEVTTPETVTQSNEEKVKTLLQAVNIDLTQEPEGLQKDIVNKYDNMVKMAQANGQTLDDETITTRLQNYIKGWKFNNFGIDSLKSPTSTYESDCSKAKNLDELKASYKQFGKEYVEFMDMDGVQDNDGNLTVNPYELFYNELQTQYKAKGDNPATAKRKALEALEKITDYVDQKITPEQANLSDVERIELFMASLSNEDELENPIYETAEMEKFLDVLNVIGTLDKNEDLVLSHDEAGAYLMSVAKFEDDKNNITSSEYVKAEMALGMSGKTVEEIMDYGYTKEEAESIKRNADYLKTNLEAYQPFIIGEGNN